MKKMLIALLVAPLLVGCATGSGQAPMSGGSKKETLSHNSVKGLYLFKVESNQITVYNGKVSL